MDDLDFGATIKGFNPGQKIFNRYTLRKILGRGGMGVVWLARDEELERDIALKFLPEVVALDKEAVRDLKRETRRSLELTHSHIVRIYDFIQDVRTAAISMEYIAGDTLAARKVDHPAGHFEADELGPWVRQLLEALAYAHTKGEVVHRDLKPANLMIDARGDLKIADFGIAASVSDSVSRVSAQAGSSGTPVYMSPQQMMGEKPAVTDDIYATGATLYELLTGKPPFYSGNVMMQVQSKLPPTIAARRKELGLEGTAVPPAWEQTIAACLAKEPGDRPASAGEIAERLGLASSPNVQRPTSNAQRSTGGATGAAATSLRTEPQTKTQKSKSGLISGIAAGVILLAGLGYYFGVYSPGQTRLAEIRRLEGEGKTAEAARLRTEQEKQDAAARARTEQEQSEAARLAAARGGIIVRTTPAGAEVTVGALEHGNAPLTIKEAKLGKYPVKVRAAGYEDWSGEVEVKENEFAELNATLARSMGTVAFTTDPAGLEVEVNQQAGPKDSRLAFAEQVDAIVPRQTVRTPGSLKLPTGRYDLTFRRPGWPEQQQKVDVTRNQTVTATAEFAHGGLELASTPAGAEVWQDGRKIEAMTPYRVSELVPARYNFELRLWGYKPAPIALTVVARQTARESVALEKLHGPETGRAWTIPDLDLTMQPIAPGTFTMGSTTGDSDEKPQTRVTLTQPFWLGRTEVTQREWQVVMGNNPSKFKGVDLPVETVSWEDAMNFCRKLTELERAAGRLPEGHAYTLPTEAQWEYSCRAGTAGDYAGNLDAMGWYASNAGFTTHPVGQKQANAWGLCDMHGNVWEWCSDWYDNYPGGNVTDPAGQTSGSGRVARGGAWVLTASSSRSAYRSRNEAGHSFNHLGFRLALVPVAQASAGAQTSQLPAHSFDTTPSANATNAPRDLIPGVSVVPLTDELRQTEKLDDRVKGLLITAVAENSGLKNEFPVGAVIENINGVTITDFNSARGALRKGANRVMHYYRGSYRYVQFEMSSRALADTGSVPSSVQSASDRAAAERMAAVAISAESQSLTIKVSVLGQVINPGQYTVEQEAKLSAVLRKAGGQNRLADVKKITIARAVSGAPQQLTVNFIDITAGRAMDIQLQDGDVITVPERLI